GSECKSSALLRGQPPVREQNPWRGYTMNSLTSAAAIAGQHEETGKEQEVSRRHRRCDSPSAHAIFWFFSSWPFVGLACCWLPRKLHCLRNMPHGSIRKFHTSSRMQRKLRSLRSSPTPIARHSSKSSGRFA